MNDAVVRLSDALCWVAAIRSTLINRKPDLKHKRKLLVVPVYMHMDISIAAQQSVKTLQKHGHNGKKIKQINPKLGKKQINASAQNDKRK